MRADLVAFLSATDLDELVAAREEIDAISNEDAAALGALVTDWSDEQALANLLMFPELIPAPLRNGTLADGLSGRRGEYAVLAAAVGLESWIVGHADAPAIAERLLALALDPDSARPIAMRSANTLFEYAPFLEISAIIDGLDHPDPGIQHNLLAALLATWGPVATLRAARGAADEGRISASTVDAIEWRLAELGVTDVDEPLETGAVVLPLLTAIPDRSSWERDAHG